MIIDQITLCDFRSFRGLQEIHLTPRVKYGAERPIILFGGLNGSGKTSLLMAVKLALYGRHGLGLGTTKAEYEEFISGCIHNPVAALVKPNSTQIELEFTYGKLGTKTHYAVKRHWILEGKKLTESLKLFENGQELSSLSQEECQGFLNELVPLGVSELFFFDGEKIAELAEDDSGGALGDAIRRLLGLDLVERLRTDLRVYALKHGKKNSQESISDEIETLESSLQEQKSDIAERREQLDENLERLADIEIKRDRLDAKLNELGGDWGRSRQASKQQATELSEDLKRVHTELRTELGGAYPLSLALPVLTGAVATVAQSVESAQREQTNVAIRSFAKTLRSSVRGKAKQDLEPALKKALDKHVQDTNAPPPLIDVGFRELIELEHLLKEQAPKASSHVAELDAKRAKISSELDEITIKIERAPDEETLRSEMDAFTELNDQLATLRSEIQFGGRELKELYQRAIDTARNLRRAHQRASEQRELETPLAYAAKARVLLKEFGEINAARKVRQLETEFTRAFQRLARKDDIALKANIDPTRFTVTLIDRDGREINKSQLSAGEKQIYAIAMLEALANTSGRRLPVIIDTPLGRLDSKHRTNLVEQYFPQASHQVILLSTDTEVDEPFYRSLSPHTSHAFEIVFDEENKASYVQEGYFWRQAYRVAV